MSLIHCFSEEVVNHLMMINKSSLRLQHIPVSLASENAWVC